MSSSEFSSQGFDLDALDSGTSDNNQDIVYEIGGGVTTVPKESPVEESSSSKENGNKNEYQEQQLPLTPLQKAEEWKQKGNEEFKNKNFLEAYDLYTEAIDACPYPIKGDKILRQRDEFNAAEREKARQRMDEETRRDRNARMDKKAGGDNKEESTTSKDEEEKDDKKAEGPATFVLPVHDNYDKLAVYYCNRAATCMYLERHDQAIRDSDLAILLNPKYANAYTRRCAAYEKTERTEEALRDAKQALALEPSNPTIRKTVARLQKIEDERLEKLKEETMSKLKDLGNSLLGNFGLSLDNFNAVQDPNTGSYSISFNQNQS